MTKRLHRAAKFVFSLLITQFAGAIGAVATMSTVATWYPALEKPPLTPPSWLFGPVWFSLYLLMGVAFYLVWIQDPQRKAVQQALTLFSLQLIANAAWSLLFFGLRSPLLGLIDIAVLWLLLMATLLAFWRINRTAGALLIPYALWVSFAAYLNLAIYLLNR